MPDDMLFAGVELGGTKTILVLAQGTRIVREEILPTGTPETCLNAASAVLREWQRDAGFEALGIASFGPLQLDQSAPDYGHMLATPKKGWGGADILGLLSRGLDCPVAIDTDGRCAMMPWPVQWRPMARRPFPMQARGRCRQWYPS